MSGSSNFKIGTHNLENLLVKSSTFSGEHKLSSRSKSRKSKSSRSGSRKSKSSRSGSRKSKSRKTKTNKSQSHNKSKSFKLSWSKPSFLLSKPHSKIRVSGLGHAPLKTNTGPMVARKPTILKPKWDTSAWRHAFKTLGKSLAQTKKMMQTA